ncbi:AAA family ATPase [Streptomyces sp. NBC_01476]|uniref:AAA family ATPase n=1 Tax=Streptomyces sp. NBC_01476 TaxID=2903881 RepID=UPI002E2F465A|nr:AAA family ATPase [Streptomyces sp. NBC_01476]
METAQSGLVGRDKEIDEIEAMPAGAAEGAGRVVVVSGGVGSGKTALLGAALDRARREGAPCSRHVASRPNAICPSGW